MVGFTPHVSDRCIIRVSDLVFDYDDGEFVLRIPHLEIAAGGSTAFIGPSGSGKTTLLNLIAGILMPRSGRVETDGVEVTGLRDDARRAFRVARIGLVFQEFELLEYINVLDNILLPYRINPALTLDRAVRERAKDLAGRVGIADQLSRQPSRLSQGERQRVAICRAVLTRPRLLLADEPTGNLDPVNTARVLDIILEYVGESGATLVAVTHEHGILDRFQHTVNFETFHGAPGQTVPSTVVAADNA